MDIQQFDFSVNLLKLILWRYTNAARLKTLIQTKQTWYDVNQTQFWQTWYTDVFNLATANNFGLAVWAYILDMPLFNPINPDPPDKPVFGFDSAEYKNFDRGYFGNDNQQQGLSVEEKRILLQLRYFSFVTRCAIPETNAFLAYVFKSYGTVYVIDNLDMSVTFVFKFPISSALLDALINYKVLPVGSGVKLNTLITSRDTFGFDSDEYKNFDRGTYAT